MKQEIVTQQNSALVEQPTAATLSFEEEATRLTEAVDRFKFAPQVRVQAPQADRLPRPSGRPAAVRLGPIELDQRPLKWSPLPASLSKRSTHTPSTT